MTRSFALPFLLLVAAAPASSQEASTPTAAAPAQAPAAQAQPASPEAKAVKAIVESTVNGIIDVLKDKANDREARRRKIFAIMDSVADFALMGKLTLGPEHWPKFDEAQRKEFIDSFTSALHNSCFDKVEIYTDETVEYDPPALSEKTKYAMTVHILSRGERYAAVFKLYKGKAGWKVYDMEVEGISLIRTYKGQYDQVLQKGAPRDLLDKMKSKALQTPDDLKKIGEGKAGKAQEKKP